MFLGSYKHLLDSKGRVVIPSKFRQETGNVIVATIGIESCIEFYTLDGWKWLVERYKQLPTNRKQVRAFLRLIYSNAVELTIDDQGRALIPSHLRKHASLSKEVIFIGLGDRFELWDYQNWLTYKDTHQASLEELAEEVSGFDV